MSSIDDFLRDAVNNPDFNLATKLSHIEFVEGVKNKTLEYTIIGEPQKLLVGGYKIMFNIFLILYMAAPILLVSLVAFLYKDWWLLFGILISYFGSLCGGWKSKLPVYGGLYFIGEAIAGHWHFKDYDDFFYMCLLWGFLWFQIADSAQYDYANFELMAKPNLYYWAVENKKLIVNEIKSN